jgi:hypothetical protein
MNVRMRDREKLNRLLTGSSGLSVQEREQVLAAVLVHVRPRAPRGHEQDAVRWLMMLGAGLTAATATSVVVMRVMDRGLATPGSEQEFVARGGDASSGSFGLRCLPDGGVGVRPSLGSACHQGDRLFFDLRPSAGHAYFSAAALSRDGLLVWYFPSDAQPSISVRSTGIADAGVLITSAQPPGHYRVFGAFSASPLTQSQMRAEIERHAAGQASAAELIEAELEVVAP